MAADQPLRVRRLGDDAVVCDRLVLGRSFGQRFMGLMFRASIEPGEGLYLPTSSIHMMFMRFPIDALFVSKAEDDGTRRVVDVRDRLPTWRGIVLPVRAAEGVVEMAAGTLEQHGVDVDDGVIFEPAGPAAEASSSAG